MSCRKWAPIKVAGVRVRFGSATFWLTLNLNLTASQPLPWPWTNTNSSVLNRFLHTWVWTGSARFWPMSNPNMVIVAKFGCFSYQFWPNHVANHPFCIIFSIIYYILVYVFIIKCKECAEGSRAYLQPIPTFQHQASNFCSSQFGQLWLSDEHN